MSRAVCWFRRDLRYDDHVAFCEALENNDEVYTVFVFDKNILSKIDDISDQRVSFIWESLADLMMKFEKNHHHLEILIGDPIEEIPRFIEKIKASKLYFNRDYEPYAKKRDEKVEAILLKKKIDVFHYKDVVLFESNEVLNGSNELYKVFTPYKNRWLQKKADLFPQIPFFKCRLKNLAKNRSITEQGQNQIFEQLGFLYKKPIFPGGRANALKRLKFCHETDLLRNYHERRDDFSLKGTSQLSAYLRHGNISIREAFNVSFQQKNKGYEVFVSELIWREFYQAILDFYPHLEESAFLEKYDKLVWPGSEDLFHLWCKGQTGVPVVDAAMRCLNETGLMPNRLRMITASYLVKILLVDWRLGMNYFAKHLFDFDLAANLGGWQWCASVGVDSVPYFRIFNPYLQSEKFDKKGEFIRRFCPELKNLSIKEIHRPEKYLTLSTYPPPAVSYEKQRQRCLELYKSV